MSLDFPRSRKSGPMPLLPLLRGILLITKTESFETVFWASKHRVRTWTVKWLYYVKKSSSRSFHRGKLLTVAPGWISHAGYILSLKRSVESKKKCWRKLVIESKIFKIRIRRCFCNYDLKQRSIRSATLRERRSLSSVIFTRHLSGHNSRTAFPISNLFSGIKYS